MARDDILHLDQFDSPVPGQGLTDTPGNALHENPAKIDKPEEAINYVIDKVQNDEQTHDAMLDLMASGRPIESIVNTVTFTGFTEGMWTPDTAELIKMPLALYFIGMALENKIEAQMFNKDPDEQEQLLNDKDTAIVMQNRRPEQYASIMQNIEEQQNAEPNQKMQEIEKSQALMGQDMGGFLPRREEI